MFVKAFTDMLAVLGCKAGGILMNIVFLPLYQRLLSSGDFGVVALIISLQALLNVMDFGTATLVARDMSASKATNDLRPAWTTWRNSENLLAGIFTFAAIGFLVVSSGLALFGKAISLHTVGIVVLAMGLLLAVALNNLVFTAINALQGYRVASAVQVGGVLGRAVLTVAALHLFRADIKTFLIVQLASAVLHFVVSRALLQRELDQHGLRERRPQGIKSVISLLLRAKPLILLGASGAIATQLDKSIISMNMSLSDVGPYFLAYTYAMAPTAILAGPVAQYFFPKVIHHAAIGAADSSAALRVAKGFSLAIALVTVVPCAVMYFYCPQLVGLWLHGSPNVASTAGLARIFLAAGLVASLSYVPSMMLNAVQDYKYLAVISSLLTVPLLASVWFFTSGQNLMSVVWAYVIYYLLMIVLVFWRAVRLPSSRAMAMMSLKTMTISVALFIGAEMGVCFGIKLLGIPSSWQHWANLEVTAMAALLAVLFLRKKLFVKIGGEL